MGLFDRKKEGSKWDAWIGEKIRQARKEKDWTQSQLAEAVDKSQNNISDYERGRLEISAVDLMFIALALEKPITYFVPPRVRGASPDDLTDKEKELIHYTSEIPDELFELLLDQAKKYREITYNKIAEQKHQEEIQTIYEEMEQKKAKKK